MNESEKYAIDQHKSDLINDLKITAKVFFVFLEIEGVITTDEREIIENGVINAERLLNVFNLLKGKRNGWSKIQEFYSQNHSATAEKLRTTAAQMSQMPSTSSVSKLFEPQKSVLDRFAAELSKYYRSSQFANISTLWGDPKCVKDFWVPLKAEDKTKMFVKGEQLDHVRLLQVLAKNVDANLAVIIGDPGSGKTTLVKKIAYDWACNYGSNAVDNQFSLVLSVPLRSVGKFNNFLESTIDYFLDSLRLRRKLKLSEKDKADLIQLVSDLDANLLIILDGLDEYNSFDESLFKSIFAPKFSRSHAPIHKSAQLPPDYYKLIITSRPYACEQINLEFPLLKFQLCLLDDEYLANFAAIYCQTSHGIANVDNYMHRHADLVIKVPLILSFVCYLADANEVEIPTNLTLLYDSLIREMMRREGKSEMFDEIIRSIGQLAYSGWNSFEFEFSEEMLKKFNVSNDSFACGFIVEKFDFSQRRRMVEFLHRSIQDFFVAIYCYQQFSQTAADRRIQMDLSSVSGEFGRFFFGICCKENQFKEVVEWLTFSNPDTSFLTEGHDTMEFSFNYIAHMAPLIIDCSDVEQFSFGEMLHSWSRIDFEQQLTKDWKQFVSVSALTASKSFAAGLKLEQIQMDSVSDTYEDYLILDANDSRVARLAVIKRSSTDVLLGRLDRIDNLFWTLGEDFSGVLESPVVETMSVPMRNVSLQLVALPTVNVTFLLSYTSCANTPDLKMFRFAFDKDKRKELLQSYSKFDTDQFSVSSSKQGKPSDIGILFLRFSISVNTSIGQSVLLGSLIKLALTFEHLNMDIHVDTKN